MSGVPEMHIHAVESGGRPRNCWTSFDLDRNFELSMTQLESYAFARRQPIVYDAMTLSGVIEFADRSLRRRGLEWTRRFALRVPVYELLKWQDANVQETLESVLAFLTGDSWEITFVPRKSPAPPLPQDPFPFSVETEAVIPYSDGLDSRAVAGLLRANIGDRLVSVRLVGSAAKGKERKPFTGVPYSVRIPKPVEASARSRGFKFALLSGIAAFLVGARKIIIPESGQGALGPAMVLNGHGYPDYRNHPSFTSRMERLLEALFEETIRFDFPRLWSTKGETLRQYAALPAGGDWAETRSCWRDQRWCSVNGEMLQCGVCAACLLRRMSVFAAGLEEDPGAYVTYNLAERSIEAGTNSNYKHMNQAHREYACAGALHLDHFASLATERSSGIHRQAVLIGRDINEPSESVELKLRDLLDRHASEWNGFLSHLGRESFVAKWVRD